MEKSEIMNQYQKQEDKLLISKLFDKLKETKQKNKVQNTDFLDLYQSQIVEHTFNQIKYPNYIFYGGLEESERRVLYIFPDKLDTEHIIRKIIAKEITAIRIELPNELHAKYTHRDYLGGIMKLGIKREKIRRYHSK